MACNAVSWWRDSVHSTMEAVVSVLFGKMPEVKSQDTRQLIGSRLERAGRWAGAQSRYR